MKNIYQNSSDNPLASNLFNARESLDRIYKNIEEEISGISSQHSVSFILKDLNNQILHDLSFPGSDGEFYDNLLFFIKNQGQLSRKYEGVIQNLGSFFKLIPINLAPSLTLDLFIIVKPIKQAKDKKSTDFNNKFLFAIKKVLSGANFSLYLKQLTSILQLICLQKQTDQTLDLEAKLFFIEDLFASSKNASCPDDFLIKMWSYLSCSIDLLDMSLWDISLDEKLVISKNNPCKTIKGGFPNSFEEKAIKQSLPVEYLKSEIINKTSPVDLSFLYNKNKDYTDSSKISIPLIKDKKTTHLLTLTKNEKFSEKDISNIKFSLNWVCESIHQWKDHLNLELSINQRTIELQKSYDLITQELEDRKVNESLQRCLFEMASLCASLDLDNSKFFYSNVCKILSNIINVDNLTISILDKDLSRYKINFTSDNNISLVVRSYIEDIINYIDLSSLPLLLNNNSLVGMIKNFDPNKSADYFKSIVCAPLIENDNLFGLISILSKNEKTKYSQRDLDTLCFVGQQLSHAIIKNESLIQLHEAYSSLEVKVVERTRDLRQQIAERKKIEDQLKFENLHDTLTQLPNRKYLNKHLSFLLKQKSKCALLFLDLDKFKTINDTLGHDVGDKVLVEFASRLKNNLRPKDFICRLSGDEFVVAMDVDISKDIVDALSARIIKAMEEPFKISSSSLLVSCSIGCFIYDPLSTVYTKDMKVTTDLLLRKADIALYQAKKSGRQCVVEFTKEDEQSLIKKQTLEKDILQALEKDQFKLSVKPIVSLNSGEIKAYECDIIWSHPIYTDVRGVELYDLLRTENLISKVDDVCFERSIMQASSYLSKDQYLILNLDPYHFEPTKISGKLNSLMKTNSLHKKQICFQIQEKHLSLDSDNAVLSIQALQRNGFQVVIKDFGVNSLSLSSLVNNNVRAIKLSYSIVKSLNSKDKYLQLKSQKMILGISNMATSMDIDIIVENCQEIVFSPEIYGLINIV